MFPDKGKQFCLFGKIIVVEVSASEENQAFRTAFKQCFNGI